MTKWGYKMRIPLSEVVENAIQKLPEQLSELSRVLQQRPANNDELFSQFAKRLADVEARIQKIESLIVTKTVAGKSKLNELGSEVARQWYQK